MLSSNSLVFLVCVATAGVYCVTVDTPDSAVMCKDVTITWSGGVAPYIVEIVNSEDPTDTLPFNDRFNPGPTNDLNVTHIVAWEANYDVYWTVTDAQGEVGKSASVTVQENPEPGEDECLN
ncbi:hypothetical protein CYLTODRAFT_487798 [Cylindrobasidium torrendii FP15055 ss-10]|uniref:Fibronectin type-III domain-containing protein n=1 Tax=Cylindrobasidium torrendii FP15055 ss-10 TaxID=1314674 RepID=A0A0D7BJZ3_9AGAR|nr:hypothetical protein CYLTODRAFT_487798 [Cylindrobasidium torrendii FP15055 ss-10]